MKAEGKILMMIFILTSQKTQEVISQNQNKTERSLQKESIKIEDKGNRYGE